MVFPRQQIGTLGTTTSTGTSTAVVVLFVDVENEGCIVEQCFRYG